MADLRVPLMACCNRHLKIVSAVAGAVMTAVPLPAGAHDWYPKDCAGGTIAHRPSRFCDGKTAAMKCLPAACRCSSHPSTTNGSGPLMAGSTSASGRIFLPVPFAAPVPEHTHLASFFSSRMPAESPNLVIAMRRSSVAGDVPGDALTWPESRSW